MARPKKRRMVAFNPDINYFKPRGIPMRDLSEVRLTVDEREAIRLADFLGMSHEEAGRQMHVSRATFGRIIRAGQKGGCRRFDQRESHQCGRRKLQDGRADSDVRMSQMQSQMGGALGYGKAGKLPEMQR